VLGLPLRGVPAPGAPRFVADYLAEQPMARVGVAVDGELRAEGAENVLVAGAGLPGAVSWREGSGEGIALASGSRAAELVLARAGGAPAGAAA
jgi:anaerobic glycerol-3-phosphate dehydrogenase